MKKFRSYYGYHYNKLYYTQFNPENASSCLLEHKQETELRFIPGYTPDTKP